MVLELLKKSKKRKLIVAENSNMDAEAVSEMDQDLQQ